MTTHTISNPDRHPRYLLIFGVLLGLFLLSVLAAFISSPQVAAAAVYVLAFAKAALVVAYYMHLRFEPAWIVVAFLVCLFFVLCLFVGMIPDMVYVYGG